MPRKPTARELGGGIDIHTAQIERLQEIVQVIMQEMNLLSMIVIEQLKLHGLCDEITCVKCGHENNVPNFGIFEEGDKSCSKCGWAFGEVVERLDDLAGGEEE
tara:strand:+ start:6951 stop:7259 length:309 start_codon:yes stop_codon:yes gene_type:complete